MCKQKGLWSLKELEKICKLTCQRVLPPRRPAVFSAELQTVASLQRWRLRGVTAILRARLSSSRAEEAGDSNSLRGGAEDPFPCRHCKWLTGSHREFCRGSSHTQDRPKNKELQIFSAASLDLTCCAQFVNRIVQWRRLLLSRSWTEAFSLWNRCYESKERRPEQWSRVWTDKHWAETHNEAVKNWEKLQIQLRKPQQRRKHDANRLESFIFSSECWSQKTSQRHILSLIPNASVLYVIYVSIPLKLTHKVLTDRFVLWLKSRAQVFVLSVKLFNNQGHWNLN